MCGGRQPSGQRGLPQVSDLLDEKQPDGLADVINVVRAELVSLADGPNARGVALHDLIAGVLVFIASACDERYDHWIVAHRRLYCRLPGPCRFQLTSGLAVRQDPAAVLARAGMQKLIERLPGGTVPWHRARRDLAAHDAGGE